MKKAAYPVKPPYCAPRHRACLCVQLLRDRYGNSEATEQLRVGDVRIFSARGCDLTVHLGREFWATVFEVEDESYEKAYQALRNIIFADNSFLGWARGYVERTEERLPKPGDLFP